MPASTSRNLSNLFRSAAKRTLSPTAASAEDVALKQLVSSLITDPPSQRHHCPSKPPTTKSAVKDLKFKKVNKTHLVPRSVMGSTNQLSREISSILCGDKTSDVVGSADLEEANDGQPLEQILDIPWFSTLSNYSVSLLRKEKSRQRKQKWVYKSTQTNRFERLIRMCAEKLGADATIQVFGKLGRETGAKEFNALICLCIENAKKTEDEEESLQQIYKAYQLFESMKEQGFKVEEETYGPFLVYLIDAGMVEEFHFFCTIIKDDIATLPRLAYYEMLLWIRIRNEDKIHELLDKVADFSNGDKSDYKESYLVALCEGNRQKEVLKLLETIEIIKVSSSNAATSVFEYLGKLALESVAKKFVLELKNSDIGPETVSKLLVSYAIGVPNLAVEDVFLKLKDLHAELEIAPSAVAYEKLVTSCCESLEVHVAVDIVDWTCEAGLTLGIGRVHTILSACEESCEYNMV